MIVVAIYIGYLAVLANAMQSPYINLSQPPLRRVSLEAHVEKAEQALAIPEGDSEGVELIKGNTDSWQAITNTARGLSEASTDGFKQARVTAEATGLTWEDQPIPRSFAVFPLQLIHIPKNGGASIEDAALQHDVHWGIYNGYLWKKTQLAENTYCTGWKVPPKMQQMGFYANVFVEETFCVIRHPYERAISEYKYLLGVPWAAQASDAAGTDLYGKTPCTAEGLNHFLKLALDKVLNDERYLHDCHFLPQSSYVFDGATKTCDNVLDMKHFPANFNDLMAKRGYPISTTEAGMKNKGDKNCGKLTVNDLDDEVKARLDVVYSDDFINFKQLF